MRIDRLDLKNFKKFEVQTIELHPQFTLLIGENGSGKTTFLDALAVAMGIWLVDPPDSTLVNSGRSILTTEIRLEATRTGDRIQFKECRPVMVRATGAIGSASNLTWARQISETGKQTSNAEAREARRNIKDIYRRDAEGERIVCPILAYYGAGRAWLPSNQRLARESKAGGPARRWAAFYDCFNERIRFDELKKWFHRETTAAGNRGGQMRPGFEVVRNAIVSCVPGGDAVWYDSDREEIVLSINGIIQPAGNLSAGQRMMLALIADIAIKAVTQNAHLLPADVLGEDDCPLPRVLQQTNGIVLIDELDVHLHPEWQRRVVKDLKQTFPLVQFICTSHSPQVIGEVQAEEIRSLDDQDVTTPERTFGIDSSRILEEVMNARPRNELVEVLANNVSELIDREDFSAARSRLQELAAQLGPDDPEITRFSTLLSFLEEPA